MGSGFRKKGQKSYAIERYPELKKELMEVKQRNRINNWLDKEKKELLKLEQAKSESEK